MFDILFLIFIIGFGNILWSAYATIAGIVPLWTRIYYLLACIAAASGAGYSTFSYSYYPNADTRFDGWPVPTVIFVRAGPGEPWLDYVVGISGILAYPLNGVVFLVLPAIVVPIIYVICRKRSLKTADDASQAESAYSDNQLHGGNSENPYESPSLK